VKKKLNVIKRQTNPFYLAENADFLKRKYTEGENTNAIFYACLDCRIALEKSDLDRISTSVPQKDRDEITKQSKLRRGIERADNTNKTTRVLRERYQMFFQAVCETIKLPNQSYDFKRSKELQQSLSIYIHSYWMEEEELKFGSGELSEAVKLVDQTIAFLKSNYEIKDTKAEVWGINLEKLPEGVLDILNTWKVNAGMKYNELLESLSEID